MLCQYLQHKQVLKTAASGYNFSIITYGREERALYKFWELGLRELCDSIKWDKPIIAKGYVYFCQWDGITRNEQIRGQIKSRTGHKKRGNSLVVRTGMGNIFDVKIVSSLS